MWRLEGLGAHARTHLQRQLSDLLLQPPERSVIHLALQRSFVDSLRCDTTHDERVAATARRERDATPTKVCKAGRDEVSELAQDMWLRTPVARGQCRTSQQSEPNHRRTFRTRSQKARTLFSKVVGVTLLFLFSCVPSQTFGNILREQSKFDKHTYYHTWNSLRRRTRVLQPENIECERSSAKHVALTVTLACAPKVYLLLVTCASIDFCNTG